MHLHARSITSEEGHPKKPMPFNKITANERQDNLRVVIDARHFCFADGLGKRVEPPFGIPVKRVLPPYPLVSVRVHDRDNDFRTLLQGKASNFLVAARQSHRLL